MLHRDFLFRSKKHSCWLAGNSWIYPFDQDVCSSIGQRQLLCVDEISWTIPLLQSLTHVHNCVVCIQTWWLHPSVGDPIPLNDNFKRYRHNRVCNLKKHRGGVYTYMNFFWSAKSELVYAYTVNETGGLVTQYHLMFPRHSSISVTNLRMAPFSYNTIPQLF